MSVSAIQDIDDPALLCWHKVKGIFYPCCVKKNTFPGIEKLKFTPTKQHAIVYLGYHVPWVGTTCAVSVKDLYPYNYEGPRKSYKHAAESKSVFEKRWSPEMVQTYLRQMIRKKKIEPSKVAHERIKLNAMLRQVIHRYEQSTKNTTARKRPSQETKGDTKRPRIVDLTANECLERDNNQQDSPHEDNQQQQQQQQQQGTRNPVNFTEAMPSQLTPVSPDHSSDHSGMGVAAVSTAESCEESVFSDMISISEQSMTALGVAAGTTTARTRPLASTDKIRRDAAQRSTKVVDSNELLKQIFQGHKKSNK